MQYDTYIYIYDATWKHIKAVIYQIPCVQFTKYYPPPNFYSLSRLLTVRPYSSFHIHTLPVDHSVNTMCLCAHFLNTRCTFKNSLMLSKWEQTCQRLFKKIGLPFTVLRQRLIYIDTYRYISVIHFFTASYAVAQLVKARHKKSKTRAFDYRWGHSNVLFT